MAQGTFHIASWRGIQVAVKKLGEEVLVDEDKVCVVHNYECSMFFPFFHNFVDFSFFIFTFIVFKIVLSSAGGHLGMSLHCFRRYGIQM